MNNKAIVRRWAKRRVSQALTEVLRERGFDTNGRRVEKGVIAHTRGLEKAVYGRTAAVNPDVLVGTVDIEVLSTCVETKYDDIKAQAELLVQKVLEICGRKAPASKGLVGPKIWSMKG